MRKQWQIAALSLSVLLGGCAEDMVARPGLEIEIRDARTGQPVAYDATVIVADGSYADTIRVREMYSAVTVEDGIVWAADNRPGTYDVTIVHPQYQTWTRTGIRVRSSGESSAFDSSPLPETVHVAASLEPAAGN